MQFINNSNGVTFDFQPNPCIKGDHCSLKQVNWASSYNKYVGELCCVNFETLQGPSKSDNDQHLHYTISVTNDMQKVCTYEGYFFVDDIGTCKNKQKSNTCPYNLFINSALKSKVMIRYGYDPQKDAQCNCPLGKKGTNKHKRK